MNKQLEAKTEESISPCIWYKSNTMLAQTTSPCNSCGGYSLACAQVGKYFPRGKNEREAFLEHFKKNWGQEI